MTLAALRQSHPQYAEAYRLFAIQRMTLAEASVRLKVSAPTVRERVQLAKRLMSGGAMLGGGRTPEEHDAELASYGRCRCHLLLPCESCLPARATLAESRPGAGATMPEGGGW